MSGFQKVQPFENRTISDLVFKSRFQMLLVYEWSNFRSPLYTAFSSVSVHNLFNVRWFSLAAGYQIHNTNAEKFTFQILTVFRSSVFQGKTWNLFRTPIPPILNVFVSSSHDHLNKGLVIRPVFKCLYSGDLNSKLVRYSNGWKQFVRWMVPYSDHHLVTELPFD